MNTWPFSHDWGAAYQVTYSFKTDIIVSRSGFEQRRALRGEPRRALDTRVTADAREAQLVDRFLTRQGPAAFSYAEPVGGETVLVRLADSLNVSHVTGRALSLDLKLAVDPGTETFPEPEVNALYSYQGRLAFPFRVNWTGGVEDDFSIPRETVDYDRGRIAVFQPVVYTTRNTRVSILVEDNRFTDFFRYQRGRQGDFWLVSALDDLDVLEIVSNTVTVVGDADIFDGVNWGVRIELTSGSSYFRQVFAAERIGDTTLLALDYDLPDDAPVRRCALMRLARFSSDDMTVQWITSSVAQVQVQVTSLPYSPPDEPFYSDVTDYYGGLPDFFDGLDFIANVQIARIGGDVTTRPWYEDGLEAVVTTMGDL